MNQVALRMLFGDPAKCLGLVFGVAFATLLITQQASIFVGLLQRTTSVILDAREVDVWVMDPSVRFLDTAFPLRDTELPRVRGVPGLAWAVPFFRANAAVRTEQGRLENAILLGVDDASLVGVTRKVVLGSLDDLRYHDAVAVDRAGFGLLWPGEEPALGKTVELNDRRAVVVAVTDAEAPFTTAPVVYTRYSQAVQYTNNGRNQMSYVLCRAAPGEDPAALARRITERTGLQALTSGDFAWKTVVYFLQNTGIPVNFGVVIALGVVVGVAVVGLTFNMFVLENLRQYAALKAIGVRNGRLVRMVLLQAGVVGSLGYGLGLGMAALFFEVTGRTSVELRGFHLPWQIAAGVAALAAVIMVLATFLSLRRVLFVDPAIVFRG